MRERLRGVAFAVVLVMVFPVVASACPVCFGDDNSAMTRGTSNGMLFMLAIIGFVQVLFAALFYSFWRRARAIQKVRDSMRIIDGGVSR